MAVLPLIAQQGEPTQQHAGPAKSTLTKQDFQRGVNSILKGQKKLGERFDADVDANRAADAKKTEAIIDDNHRALAGATNTVVVAGQKNAQETARVISGTIWIGISILASVIMIVGIGMFIILHRKKDTPAQQVVFVNAKSDNDCGLNELTEPLFDPDRPKLEAYVANREKDKQVKNMRADISIPLQREGVLVPCQAEVRDSLQPQVWLPGFPKPSAWDTRVQAAGKWYKNRNKVCAA